MLLLVIISNYKTIKINKLAEHRLGYILKLLTIVTICKYLMNN